MINYEIKFLSCDECISVKSGDLKTFRYELKKKIEESIYDIGKKDYCERRGGLWRSLKTKQLKKLETKFQEFSVVNCEWKNDTLVVIVFSSGAVAYVTFKIETLDIHQILFDQYLVGKLSSQYVTGAVISDSHILYTHVDRLATLVSFGKPTTSNPCRISERDPHIQSLELGGSVRRTERHISWFNIKNDILRTLIWSSGGTADPAPWSPVPEDYANLHLYHIFGNQLSLIAYHQLENETLCAELSEKLPNNVHIVEQISYHKSGVQLSWLSYEVSANCNNGSVKLTSYTETATNVTLPAPAKVVKRSPCDQRLLVACIDATVHVIHNVAGLMSSTRAGFIASDVRWCGELILASEENGRIQCFDKALSVLHHHTKCLDLNGYIRDSRRMQILTTRPTKSGSLILAIFSGGPLTLLRITHPELFKAWIIKRYISNAVTLLRSSDWELDGARCLWAMQSLLQEAIRKELRGEYEQAAQSALGAFLAPPAPHGPNAQRFAPAVHGLARKFFHHLLRRGRVEKALSLAVDLDAWDLFADAKWAATRYGLLQLADEAATLCDQYSDRIAGSECSDSCSQCSSHSCTSESENSTSASSDLQKTKPPPLPRIPLPTVVQVPITQAESFSTNAIRPNIHQYLERDNTLWNTEVKNSTAIYSERKYKSILNQNDNWQESNFRTKNIVNIGEGTSSQIIDIVPTDRITHSMYRNVYQKELRKNIPNTLYRYQNNVTCHPQSSDMYKYDVKDKNINKTIGEKNKVKFSDTVTIAVMSETHSNVVSPTISTLDNGSQSVCFARAGTTLDYVEV